MMKFLSWKFNMILASENSPDEWWKSLLVPLFKSKGVVKILQLQKDNADEPHNEDLGKSSGHETKRGSDDCLHSFIAALHPQWVNSLNALSIYRSIFLTHILLGFTGGLELISASLREGGIHSGQVVNSS